MLIAAGLLFLLSGTPVLHSTTPVVRDHPCPKDTNALNTNCIAAIQRKPFIAGTAETSSNGDPQPNSTRPADHPSAGDESAIRAAYAAGALAFEQHHPERFREFFTSDFIETREGSAAKRDRQQFIQGITDEDEHALPPVHVHFELKGFQSIDRGVLVSVDEDTSYKVRGADGQIHVIEYRQRSEDEWVQQPGQWKCRRESDHVPYLTRADRRDVSLQDLANLVR